jgi:hypothetical protein
MKTSILRNLGLLTSAIVGFSSSGLCQGVVNNNAKMVLAPSTTLKISGGGFTNLGAGGQVISNNATIDLDGDWVNDSPTNVFGATPTASTGGTVVMSGAAQEIAGDENSHFFNLQLTGSARKDLLVDVAAPEDEAAKVFGTLTLGASSGVNLNSRTLTVERNVPAAIVNSGGRIVAETPPRSRVLVGGNPTPPGGPYLTENGYGYVNWNMGTATGDFRIPFGTTSGDLIELRYNVLDAGTPINPGDVNDYKRFSTYRTPSWDNLPTPLVPYDNPANAGLPLSATPVDQTFPRHVPHITNAYASASSLADAPNADRVIDRYWIIDNDAQGKYAMSPDYTYDPISDSWQPDWTNYPEIEVTFGFNSGDWNDAGNSMTGTSQLIAQRFNHLDPDGLNPLSWDAVNSQWVGGGLWGDWRYSTAVNASANSLTLTLTRVEDYFPIWTLADNSDPLPIELARFVGQCDNGSVLITWTTFSEIDNDFFTLERSRNGIDWEIVDVIEGAGNSNVPITYMVNDNQSFGGTSYYRLKDTDIYGKENYSQVIAVTCGNSATDFDLINAYEVDNSDLVVEFTAKEFESFEVVLFDISGRIVFDHAGVAQDGLNKLRLPVQGVAKGIYIVDLHNDSKRFSRKVLMKR